MSLDRKDLRVKLDAEVHAQLVAVAEVDQVDMAEYVERLIAADVAHRFHKATLLVQKAARLGLAGNVRGIAPQKSGRSGE